MVVAQAVVVKFMVMHSCRFLIYLMSATTLDILFTSSIYSFYYPNISQCSAKYYSLIHVTNYKRLSMLVRMHFFNLCRQQVRKYNKL